MQMDKNADESSIKVGMRKGTNTTTFPIYLVSRKDISILNLNYRNHAVKKKVFIYLLPAVYLVPINQLTFTMIYKFYPELSITS